MPKMNSSSVKNCESSCPRLAQKFSIVTRAVVTPIVEIFFTIFYHVLKVTLLVKRNWHKKSANHGSWRFLPPASPMGHRHPNHEYRPHPNIMGKNHAYAQFGHPTHVLVEIRDVIDTSKSV
jgi:hypothetical protein